MNSVNITDIPNYVHIIIRFLIEAQIKHSFMFNSKLQKKLDKCLKYLIGRIYNKKRRLNYESKDIEKEINSSVTNSINLEKIVNENISIDETLVCCLEKTINYIKNL